MFELVFDCRNKKSKNTIVVDLSSKKTALQWREFGGEMANELFRKKEVLFDMINSKESEISEEEVAYNIAFGITLGSYSFDKYDSKKSDEFSALERICFHSDTSLIDRKKYDRYIYVADAVRYVRDLSSEPREEFSDAEFLADLKRLEYLGLKVEILKSRRVAVIKWYGVDRKKDFDVVILGATRDNSISSQAMVAGVIKSAALQRLGVNVAGIVLLEDEELNHWEDYAKNKLKSEVVINIVADSKGKKPFIRGKNKEILTAIKKAGNVVGEKIAVEELNEGDIMTLDISAKVIESKGKPLYPKGVSAFGLMLLDKFLKTWESKSGKR